MTSPKQHSRSNEVYNIELRRMYVRVLLHERQVLLCIEVCQMTRQQLVRWLNDSFGTIHLDLDRGISYEEIRSILI